MANESTFDGATVPEGERVGFCQDCGRPLTAATIRTVGSGVFCEPCLERRIAAGPGGIPGASPSGYAAHQGPAGPNSWQQVGAYPPPPPVPPPPGTPIYTGVPTPWLAGLLGFIPGVGAMYNGQFAKGVVHLIVFAVLVSLSDHVSGVFGLFVAGWIFFMAFEAYQTARARLMGLPLPDPFGWNNIGERLGLNKNWPGNFTSGVPPTSSNTTWQQPVSPASAQPGNDWVGYVPPTNFASTPAAGAPVVPPPPPAPSIDPFATAAGATITTPASSVPYTTASVPYTEVGAAPATMPILTPQRRFPVGALWLIGLGVLFLLGNVNHAFHISWRWLAPLFVGSFAIYLLVIRTRAAQAADTLGRPYQNRLVMFRGPIMLLTVAVLMGLQSFDILTFGQTWPVLLVVLGVLLVLERASARKNVGPIPVMDSDVNAGTSSWNPAKGGQ